ncbi:MAG: hypothetical protein ACI4UU_04395 [Clostridia bacterium]
MKKKIIVALLLIIVLVLALGVYIYAKPEKVEELSDIKILDCYKNEITNYKENKMAFTIQKQYENQKIKVNGVEYENGQRFYEVGEYEVEVSKNFKKEISKVSIKDIQKNENHEYNIYIISTTLPTFSAILDMSQKNNLKGFFWTQSTNSLDFENIKNSMKNLTISEYVGNKDEYEFKRKIIPEIEEYIKNVIQEDEDAYFNLYVDEYRFYLDMELFGKIGIGDNRYTYTLCSDGTLSYVTNYNTTGFSAHREYKIRGENCYEVFLTEKAAYNDILNKIRSNQLEYNDFPGSYLVMDDGENYNYDYMLISTLRDNVRYLLQYPQMIDFKDEKVAKEMENANLIQMDLKKEYSELIQDKKEIFFSNIKLNKKTLDKNYFTEENATYLVITGTKPYYGELNKEKFEDLINKVYNDYSKKYTILYKPHPSALPDESQQAFLDSKNIKTLPGTIPMEAIMFIYPNIKLGGFPSSLYMSAENGQTEFFFANNKDNLVEPLNQLYDNLFNNVKFYNFD